MNTSKPILHATLVNASGNEVRHLLIDLIDGAGNAELLQFSAGVETPIAHGTQYEMGRQADALSGRWITDEGFRRARPDQPAYEPLERTTALAIRLGYKIIYDPRFKKLDGLPLNATGAVRLAEWPGMTPKNGGGYEYALNQGFVYARPTLPPNHQSLVAPSGGKEFAAFMSEVTALLETIGPRAEFLLASRF